MSACGWEGPSFENKVLPVNPSMLRSNGVDNIGPIRLPFEDAQLRPNAIIPKDWRRHGGAAVYLGGNRDLGPLRDLSFGL